VISVDDPARWARKNATPAVEAKNTFIFRAGCQVAPPWCASIAFFGLRWSRRSKGSSTLITLCLTTRPTVWPSPGPDAAAGVSRSRPTRSPGPDAPIADGKARSHESYTWWSRTSRLPTKPVEPLRACRAAGGSRDTCWRSWRDTAAH